MQQLETDLDKTTEQLLTTTMALEEKERGLQAAELELNALGRKILQLEEDLEKCEDRLSLVLKSFYLFSLK